MFTFRHIIRSLSGWCDFLCRETTRHAIAQTCCGLCLHKTHSRFVRLCDDCHDDERQRREECVSRCVVSQDSRNEGIRRKLYYGTNLYVGEEDTATGIVDVVADDVVNVSQFSLQYC